MRLPHPLLQPVVCLPRLKRRLSGRWEQTDKITVRFSTALNTLPRLQFDLSTLLSLTLSFKITGNVQSTNIQSIYVMLKGNSSCKVSRVHGIHYDVILRYIHSKYDMLNITRENATWLTTGVKTLRKRQFSEPTTPSGSGHCDCKAFMNGTCRHRGGIFLALARRCHVLGFTGSCNTWERLPISLRWVTQHVAHRLLGACSLLIISFILICSLY